MPSRRVLSLTLAIALLTISCQEQPYVQGQRLYEAHCQNCHMEAGDGLENVIPPLAGADYLRDHQSSIPCILINGQQGPIVVNGITYNQMMPGKDYTAVQITNLINYINNAWGNDYGVVKLEEMKSALSQCD